MREGGREERAEREERVGGWVGGREGEMEGRAGGREGEGGRVGGREQERGVREKEERRREGLLIPQTCTSTGFMNANVI